MWKCNTVFPLTTRYRYCPASSFTSTNSPFEIGATLRGSPRHRRSGAPLTRHCNCPKRATGREGSPVLQHPFLILVLLFLPNFSILGWLRKVLFGFRKLRAAPVQPEAKQGRMEQHHHQGGGGGGGGPPYAAGPSQGPVAQPPYNHLLQQQQQQLHMFWAFQMQEIEQVSDFKNHQLPLARIKKIMKADEDVRMISAEAPVLFAKACEMFILELTLRSWIHAEENKRRTLQKNDIAAAITRTDIFDFLVDIVPRDDSKEEGLGLGRAPALPDGAPYYYPPMAAAQMGGAAPAIMMGRPAAAPPMDPSLYMQQQRSYAMPAQQVWPPPPPPMADGQSYVQQQMQDGHSYANPSSSE